MIGWPKTHEAALEAARELWAKRPRVPRFPTIDEWWFLLPDSVFFWLVKKFGIQLESWLFVDDEPQFATGGYVGGPSDELLPLRLSRGHAFLTTAQLEALGGMESARRLFPDTDIELIFTAAEVRAAGQGFLDQLNTVAE